MNRWIFTGLFMLVAIGSSLAQAPYGINYQAVARDKNGDPVQINPLEVRFTIMADRVDGTIEWQEIHSTQTNQFGLFNLIIGQGERTGGLPEFKDISWGSSAHYLKVEIKLDGTFTEIGNTQMLWVPYALYAENSGNSGNKISITYDPVTHQLAVDSQVIADFSSLYQDVANTVQNISLDGNNLVFSKNGQNYQLDLSKFLDNTDQQTLSLNGYTLSISGGNSVTLPISDYQNLSISGNTLSISKGNSVTVDADPANEVQTLALEGNQLKIQHAGITDGAVTLPDLYEDRDSFYLSGFSSPRKISLRNELTVSKNKDSLTINRGNTIPIDGDINNEIQDINLSADTLKISKNSESKGVNLSAYRQNLSKNGNLISLSNANSVSIADQDSSSSNELISDLTYNGQTSELKITEGIQQKTVSLKRNVVCFSAIKNTGGYVLAGSKNIVIFENEKFDPSDVYNPSTGVFKVPQNEGGIYYFVFSFNNLNNMTFDVMVDDNPLYTLVPMNSNPVLINLIDGQEVSLRITVSIDLVLPQGSFIGYKVQ